MYPVSKLVRGMRGSFAIFAVLMAVGCAEQSEPVAPKSLRGPRLELMGGPSFNYMCDGVACDFQGNNWDSQSAAWDFGDGASANGPQAFHTFAAPGNYMVRYTATDWMGNAYTAEKLVSIFNLSVIGRRVRGDQVADLTWAPASGAVDVYRDGAFVAALASSQNRGTYSDNLGKRGRNAQHVYQVCEHDTERCSNFATAW